jgi:AraC family transcriptional regulator of arabinose operon
LFLLDFFRLLKSHYDGILLEQRANVPKLSHRASQIMQWVEEHYSEPFELERIASDLQMSPYHLSHLFSKATGTSINQYVKARRIQQASLLLNQETLSITAITEAVGLTNPSYFSKYSRS